MNHLVQQLLALLNVLVNLVCRQLLVVLSLQRFLQLLGVLLVLLVQLVLVVLGLQ